MWIKKIEKSNKPFYIPPELYSSVKQFVEDAFLHDFNMIIEEFNFYQQLSPKMQSELITTIFKDFQHKFAHFFSHCEKGFLNELIINMYCRIYPPEQTIIQYGENFREVFFITEGGVLLYNYFQIQDFMYLPQYSVFGDYQVLYNLKSNIVFKTADQKSDVKFMCVTKKVFMNLCDFFPQTAEKLKYQGLLKRHHYLKFMQKLDQSSVLKAFNRTIKKRVKDGI